MGALLDAAGDRVRRALTHAGAAGPFTTTDTSAGATRSVAVTSAGSAASWSITVAGVRRSAFHARLSEARARQALALSAPSGATFNTNDSGRPKYGEAREVNYSAAVALTNDEEMRLYAEAAELLVEDATSGAGPWTVTVAHGTGQASVSVVAA